VARRLIGGALNVKDPCGRGSRDERLEAARAAQHEQREAAARRSAALDAAWD
jgi:hypothetical protein